MFTVYHSNQLELLKSLTSALIQRDPFASVFEQEVILVQSQGMGQWLQMQLADEMGIAANIALPFPTQFVWDVYRIFVPNLPEKNLFNADLVTWRLLTILPTLIETPQFSELKTYIGNGINEKKLYQLASKIAGLFDQYLVYRQDWIAAWEKGELVADLTDSQQWQAALWRELVASEQTDFQPLIHRTDIHQHAMQCIKQSTLDATCLAQLPKRIFVFGIMSLPPIYLDLLYALGQHIDVHMMFMNPCKWYWGDIIDERSFHKMATKKWAQLSTPTSRQLIHPEYQHNLQAYLQSTNPLLANWGKLGRDLLSILQQYEGKRDIEAFVDRDGETLLDSLLQSILNLENGMIAEQKLVIAPTDDSISIHACASEQREVEVLYDYLLSVLDHHPQIDLRDCVVMVTDIDRYAPYIRAVFGNTTSKRQLPFSISDQRFRQVNPIVQGFFLLLDLANSRFDLDSVFALLDIPAIAEKFNINEPALRQLQHWVIDSGIRFGLALDRDHPHSWALGLQRMLLGYVMNGEQGDWQGILPYDHTTGLEAELVGVLSDFIALIAKWHVVLAEPKTVLDWQPVCMTLLNDFFVFNPDTEPFLLKIEEQWQNIIQQASVAGHDNTLSSTILYDAMQAKLEQNYLSHRFLAGKINFCTMMPMRSVPFQVVCLLGMNDREYPRSSVSVGFDLISYHSRLGDRSRRNDDNYLFLEAILSAQQKLYISYIGRNIQTHEERYPSILIDKLLDYVLNGYMLNGDESLTDTEQQERLRQHLVNFHTRTPFNPENYASHIATNRRSYCDEWLPAAKNKNSNQPFVAELDAVIETMTVHQLIAFYQHPVRELLKTQLGYRLNNSEQTLPTAEDFSLDHLQLYQVNREIIQRLLDADDAKTVLLPLYKRLVQSSQIPYGAFGQIIYDEQFAKMVELAEQIQSEKTAVLPALEVNVNIAGCTLQGWLNHVQNDGILDWKPSKISIRDGISLWIEHLLLTITQQQDQVYQSRIYGRDNTIWRFKPLTVNDAYQYLEQLVIGYQQGMRYPLFMPLKSSWSWLESCYNEKEDCLSQEVYVRDKAKKQFITSWQGDGGHHTQAECDDYYFRVFPELNEELLATAIAATETYLLPLIRAKSDANDETTSE